MLKKMKKGMGRRGFTLFTALISFVLIFLVVLLVQTMISAERNTSDIVSDVEEEQEMQAIADLARADALQAFSLTMRSAIEAHITRDISGNGIPDNQLLLSPDIFDGNPSKQEILERIKTKFTQDFFGGVPNQACINNCGGDPACLENCKPTGEQFASIAAIYLSTILQRSDDVGQYDISIQSGTGSPNIEAEVKPVIAKAILATDEFIEIVGCDGTPTQKGCPTGTFYVNLDLRKISEEDYEKLPQIVVKKRSGEGGVTGRILKEPLLPKANLKLYVPLRIFKAIVAAK